jgi:hypothetical protein
MDGKVGGEGALSYLGRGTGKWQTAHDTGLSPELSVACARFFMPSSWYRSSAGRCHHPDNRRLLVLAHVNIVDVTTGSVRRDYNVTMAADRVAALEASTVRSGPADAQVIDARGKYLILGLVDMHVHGSDERFLNLFVDGCQGHLHYCGRSA